MNSDAPLRIAFLVPFEGQGGAEVVLKNIFYQLPKDAFEVFLIAPKGQGLVEVAGELGYHVHEDSIPKLPSTSIVINNTYIFNPFATFLVIIHLMLFARRIRKWMRDNHIDVLYTGAMLSHFIGALSTVSAQHKLIWHVHDIMSPRYALGIGPVIFGWIARNRVDHIIVPSQAVCDSIRHKNNITVIPNGIDVEAYLNFSSPTLKEELGIQPDIPVIGLVARLMAWKGQRVFLEATRKLVDANHKFHSIIVGDSVFTTEDFRIELENLRDQLGIKDYVTLTGYRRDVPNVMHSLDILVVPSIRPEPFGLVIVEAMASHKPVVASDAGGPREIIVPDETGLLFAPGDSDALAHALEVLLTNPALRTQFGNAGAERAKQLYTNQHFGDEVVRVFRSTAPNHAAARES